VLRWVACALLLMTLSACAGMATPAPAANPTAPASAPGGVTLVLWHGWSGASRQALSRLVDAFNRQNTGGRVSLQAMPLTSFDADLRAAMTYGGGPHLMLVPNTWVGSLAEREALLPLDDLTADEQGALIPAALGGSRARGADGAAHIYALPLSFDTLALYYNKANVLAPPADTADLIGSAHGLSDPSAPRWGLAINLSLENTIGYLYAAGGRVFADDGSVALDGDGRVGAEQWLAWLLDLQNDPRLLARADSSIQVDRAVKDGQALMAFDWSHQAGLYRSLWGDNMGVALLPLLSSTEGAPQPYVKSDVLAINSRGGAAERAAALAFLRFMTGAEAQAELLRSGLQPVRADLKLDDVDTVSAGAAQAFRAQAARGQPMPNMPTREREIVRRELALMHRQVLRGEATPADAITEAARRLREQLTAPPSS
jgi:arabinogalactan oligomer/maltooligosaccharide transport system substrate-binding protein